MQPPGRKLSRKMYSRADFGGELNKTNYYKEDIDQLVGGISDPIKKAGLIFGFVKQKMNWNGNYRATVQSGVTKSV